MGSPRWRKLWRDMIAERGRILLMVTAISVSLMAVGAVLGSYAVLTREIAANYLGTRPASATLEIPSGIDGALLARARSHPLVAEAEAREVVVARVRSGDDWRRLLLFVIDDFADLRLNRFRPERGAWPPPDGTMLIERSATRMLGAVVGRPLLVKTPHGEARQVPISGLVHDPGLAPAWQEQTGYAYITRATLRDLGEPPVLSELRVELAGRPRDQRAIEAQAAQLATWLGERGSPVEEIRVPPPAQHPHQRQMASILLMMLAFSVMALFLSAILVATSLSAMLARQVREIGVMKAIGGRAAQIAGLYVVLVGLLGLASVIVAIPLGRLGAAGLAGAISTMLNFTIENPTVPAWVFAVQALAGILVPLLVAAIPVRRASRITVRQAIDDHGLSGDRLRAGMAIILAIVGILGLGSTMGVSVVERTRELGVMKTLGATPGRIVRMLVSEGVAVGLASWFVAFAASVPLTLFVDALVGRLGFLAPLPLVLSPAAAALWLGLVAVVSSLATMLPARRAARLVIGEALART